jgi:hypothetical protein
MIEFQSKQTFGQDDDYIVKIDASFWTTLSNILVKLNMTKLLIVWTPIKTLWHDYSILILKITIVS